MLYQPFIYASFPQLLRKVTLTAPSIKELKAIYLARDLYMPKTLDKELSEEEENAIYKRFFKGYNAFRD